MDKMTWLDLHGSQGSPSTDARLDDARRWYEEEHPGVLEAFGDLIEVRTWATRYDHGVKLVRTDTETVLAEYDLG